MSSRFLIAAAVLAAGCEQWKAPKRILELEGKVDELTKQVAALEAKPAAAAGHPSAPGEHAGSGSAGEGAEAARPAGEGSAEADAGPGDDKPAKPPDKPDGKPDKVASADAKPARPGDDKADPAKPGAGSGDDKARSGDSAGSAADPPSSDPAMDNLLAVVAKNVNKPRADKPSPPQWSYDGKTGPAAWGTLDPAWATCAAGVAQSPIDIEPRAGTATPIKFHYQPTAATIVDTGHTLQLDFAPGSSIELGDTSYELIQLQVHAPSEHTIAGEHYPLELQLLHRDAAGKLAAIGVLYDTGAESRSLGALWPAWPRKVGAGQKLARPVDPSALLPETRTMFRYTGSLTSPPCTEGVVWSVMRRTLTDTKAHLAAYGLHYAHTARDPQPLNDRKIE